MCVCVCVCVCVQDAQVEIINSLCAPGRQLSPEVAKAVHALTVGDKKPSELPSITLIEVRDTHTHTHTHTYVPQTYTHKKAGEPTLHMSTYVSLWC